MIWGLKYTLDWLKPGEDNGYDILITECCWSLHAGMRRGEDERKLYFIWHAYEVTFDSLLSFIPEKDVQGIIGLLYKLCHNWSHLYTSSQVEMEHVLISYLMLVGLSNIKLCMWSWKSMESKFQTMNHKWELKHWLVKWRRNRNLVIGKTWRENSKIWMKLYAITIKNM